MIAKKILWPRGRSRGPRNHFGGRQLSFKNCYYFAILCFTLLYLCSQFPFGDWLEKKNVPAIIIKQQFLLNLLKVSLSRKEILMSSILPKNKLKNAKFCPSLLGQKFFVCFLEEFKKPNSPFEINWPLKTPLSQQEPTSLKMFSRFSIKQYFYFKFLSPFFQQLLNTIFSTTKIKVWKENWFKSRVPLAFITSKFLFLNLAKTNLVVLLRNQSHANVAWFKILFSSNSGSAFDSTSIQTFYIKCLQYI